MWGTVGGLGVVAAGLLALAACGSEDPPRSSGDTVAALRALPAPASGPAGSLEAAIAERRSVRTFEPAPLREEQVGQLLWSAQGVTDPGGARAAPSAGATYPLQLLAVTTEGVARYHPEEHALSDHRAGDQRAALADAAYAQEWIAEAGLVLVISGVVERTAARYGDRAERFMLLEAGHAAQNVLLQAVALELGATPVGAFDAGQLRSILDLPADEEPLYLLPVGVIDG